MKKSKKVMMLKRLARSIVRRKYPIRFILKPIRFQCFG